MDVYFPIEGGDSRHPNRKKRKRRPIQVRTGELCVDVSSLMTSGLSVAIDAPVINRGYVDIYDGDTHLLHGLIYQTGEVGNQRHYGFKSLSKGVTAPPADFVSLRATVAGLLEAPKRHNSQ